MLQIKKSNYQGYVWFSDETRPQVTDGEFSLELADTTNPFVIEGQLYDCDSGISISIKHADGRYYVAQYEVKEDDFNNKDIDLVEYMPHRIPGVSKLRFLQKWEPKPDELCCNMESLQPTDRIFVGFKKQTT